MSHVRELLLTMPDIDRRVLVRIAERNDDDGTIMRRLLDAVASDIAELWRDEDSVLALARQSVIEQSPWRDTGDPGVRLVLDDEGNVVDAVDLTEPPGVE